MPVSVSKGSAAFDPTTDSSCQEVFRRADLAMYRDKAEYYRTHEDRRNHYTL